MERDDLRERMRHGTPDFPAAVYDMKFGPQCDLLAPLHYHTEFELLAVTGGDVRVQIEKESFIVRRGEGIFIHSGLIHMISAVDKSEHSFIAVVFDSSFLCSESDRIFTSYIRRLMDQSLRLPFFLPGPVCEQIKEICRAYEEAPFGYEFFIKSSLYNIFFRLMKEAEKTGVPVQSIQSVMIKDVIDYMQSHYSETVSLQLLAGQANTSKEYLCRIFKEMTGDSPIVYLNRYRIRQSTFLLPDRRRTISDIALSCGFHNSSYYNKLFMRYIGCTPTEFRREPAAFGRP